MARPFAELERDVRSLSTTDKERLLDLLISDVDVSAEELELLAHEFDTAVDRSIKALDSAISRFERLDAELERGRIEVREQVLDSGETWPFPLPSNQPPGA